MNLTTIQYDVIMQAISNAKNEIAKDTFIEPEPQDTEGYNSEDLIEALIEVENKIISANIPS